MNLDWRGYNINKKSCHHYILIYIVINTVPMIRMSLIAKLMMRMLAGVSSPLVLMETNN